MYIRRTQTRSTTTGESYTTYRLVRSMRTGDRVRQVTVLNLGRHFAVAQAHWPTLCARLEQLLSGQGVLLDLECPPGVEREAQRLAAALLAREGDCTPKDKDAVAPSQDIQAVDVDSLQLIRPRSVGVEHVGLWAMRQVGFEAQLERLGFTGPQRAAAVGTIIARMAAPGSERAAQRWLTECSGLGELLEIDFEAQSPMALYRVSDQLLTHPAALEEQLFDQVSDLFSLSDTVTLYDLTNTYFEGAAAGLAKAQRGHSKERRTDCPLLTLGLVLDGSGFVRRSRVFAGNAVEGRTLDAMLTGLGAGKGALVVMDRGVATEANLQWLKAEGYRYVVVSRERRQGLDLSGAEALETAGGASVQLVRVLDEENAEMRLYCYSEGRAQKEAAIARRFAERFEAGLQKIADGLSQPRTQKRLDKLSERIGRLKAQSHGIGQHYRITLTPDAEGQRAVALSWERLPREGSLLTDPGCYCLRSSETDWDAETLWRTYSLLTDLEAVFRSLKSELGLRPVYHHTDARADGHLFISVLAYSFVQIIRRRLRAAGITDSWSSLRQTLGGQCRVTATFRRADGRALHVRKATRAEPEPLAVYQALGLDPAPGGVKKMIV
jgi:hypothetical protein